MADTLISGLIVFMFTLHNLQPLERFHIQRLCFLLGKKAYLNIGSDDEPEWRPKPASQVYQLLKTPLLSCPLRVQRIKLAQPLFARPDGKNEVITALYGELNSPRNFDKPEQHTIQP